MLCGAAWVDVGDLGQFLGLPVPVGHEGPVDQESFDDPQFGGAGGPEGEPDGAAALLDVGGADQGLGGRVGGVVDAGDPVALVDPALVGGVRLHGAVPVEVVGGEVEDGRGVGAQGGRPVQLVAGEFDGEDVVRLRGEDHVDQRGADVADRLGAQAGRGEDGGEHPGGGGLAVGAGDAEPVGGTFGPQPPGDLHVADDLDARLGGGREERRVRLPAGRGDDQVGRLGEGVGVAEADGDGAGGVRGVEGGGELGGARQVLFALTAVDDGDVRAEPARARAALMPLTPRPTTVMCWSCQVT